MQTETPRGWREQTPQLAVPGTTTPQAPAHTTRSMALLGLLLAGCSALSQAATLTVSSGADAGGVCPGAACTLRSAIAAAVPGDTINFSVSTITLTSAELLINKNLRIVGGAGVTVTRQAGSPDFRIFQVAAGAEVEFSNLTISNGTSALGGGIRNDGTLLVTDSAIRNNQCVSSGADRGCGIFNSSSGVLTLGNTNVFANSKAGTGSARGGGIHNDGGELVLANSAVYENLLTTGTLNFGAGISSSGGLVEMFESRVADNQCAGTQAIGGGMYIIGTMIIRRSTVSGNVSRSSGPNLGGGIYNETNASLTVDNSTLSGNRTLAAPSSANGGAGLFNDTGARAVLIASTISANDASTSTNRAGGIHSPGLLIVSNSLIDGNSSGSGSSDIDGNLISAGHNLLGNTSGVTISGISTGNQFGVLELVSPLGAWGGPQSTHALLPGSPAINAGATPSEIQQLTVSGTAGTFTLTFNGQTTAPLAFNASPAAVQAALEGLSSIGSGNVVVVSGASHVVMFTGTLAGTNLADLTSAAAGGASVTQRTLWNGGTLPIDQRSIARPQQGTPDIGAFESRGFTLAITSGNHQITNVNDPFVAPLSLSVTSSGGEPVNGGRISFTGPASGASAMVSPNPVSISAGAATPGSVTANGTVGGPYLLAATARGANTVNYSLSNRAAPVLSISDASITEGNNGTQLLSFTVTKEGESAFPISVSFATANDTATVADNDYVAASGTATIPVTGAIGSTMVNVSVNGDTVPEADERFFINLSAPQRAVIGDGQAIGTISNDDTQTTTTTVSTTPAPSYVGQSYTVTVTVSGSQISPAGTVSVSDGSSSCGPLNLVAGTSPVSTASCTLTGTTPGTRTLTATYTPAGSISQGSSGSVQHTVNLIQTSLSVSGPGRGRINAFVSYFANLGLSPSGLPAPTGTLTLTAGSSSCTATLPDTGCNLLLSTPGPVTVSASYSGDSAHAPATSSSAGNLAVVVFALADVAISKSNGQSTYLPGDLLVYTVIVGNAGPDPVHALRISDPPPAGLADISFSCTAAGGAACPVVSGSGGLDLAIGPLPVGGTLTFTVSGNVSGSPAQITNTASLILPGDTSVEDPAPANNSASDTDQLELLFRDGFEAPVIEKAAGSQPLDILELARTLGAEARVVTRLTDAAGEALRVYARLHGPDLEYALATRATDGALRLGPWTALPAAAVLHWRAQPRPEGGWRLEAATLR